MSNGSLAELLAAWLPTRRWFAGGRATVRGVTIRSDVMLASGDPELRHLLADVKVGAETVSYQILVGLGTRLAPHLSEAMIGTLADGRVAYDGALDPDLTAVLLRGIAAGRSVGPLRFIPEPDAVIDIQAPARTLPALQSNTAVVFGQSAILKLLRRPFEGHHPDLEIPARLARAGSRLVAAPLGWIEADGAILAILSRYFAHASDGWKLATASLRAAEPDFSAQARLLGQATAQLHAELAQAFGVSILPRASLADLTGNMAAELAAAVGVVTELAGYRRAIQACYTGLAGRASPIPIQRIHGDYHLEQVLGTEDVISGEDAWVILDFEGEPSVPLARRRAFTTTMRDVAGMLRSFDYAARHEELREPGNQRLKAVSADWVARCQDAFCAGYGAASGSDPRANGQLLRALTLQKAVYEAVYEARHRPGWLPIPLHAIAEAVDEGDR
jgi:maltokinase